MLNVALTGLRAFQTALDTTSHNIANSGTPGFSRQRVDLASQAPAGLAGLVTGSGVRITGVNRTTDVLLAMQMRSASSAWSSLDAYTTKAADLNGLFAQRRNTLRPRFWRMLTDIRRFYANAEGYLDSAAARCSTRTSRPSAATRAPVETTLTTAARNSTSMPKGSILPR